MTAAAVAKTGAAARVLAQQRSLLEPIIGNGTGGNGGTSISVNRQHTIGSLSNAGSGSGVIGVGIGAGSNLMRRR